MAIDFCSLKINIGKGRKPVDSIYGNPLPYYQPYVSVNPHML